MTNTKERHQEIQAAAVTALNNAGGFETIDNLPPNERVAMLRNMATHVIVLWNCTRDTARRNVTKALQQARHPFNDLDRWGGARPNTGPIPLPADQKRQPVSTRLTPGSKELAQAIAEILELPGWGHAIDVALIAMIEGDLELKVQLAEMGIVIKANDGKGL